MLSGILLILFAQFVLGFRYGMNFLVLFIFSVAMIRKDGYQFYKDWWKFVILFYLYEIGRAYAYDIGRSLFNTKLFVSEIVDLERSVFFFLDDLPNVLLQRYLHPILTKPDWYDYIFFLFYSVFFFIWAVTAYVLWVMRRNLFNSYFYGLLAFCFFAIFIFILVPTAPPWYASEKGLIEPKVERVIWSFEYLPGVDISSINEMGQNEFAAIPSLHTGWAMYAALYWIKAFKKKSLVMLIFPIGIAFSTWYGAEHYVIDSIIGAIMASMFFYLSLNWDKVKNTLSYFNVKTNR